MPSSAPVPVRWPKNDDLKKLRISYFEDDGRTPVTPETRARPYSCRSLEASKVYYEHSAPRPREGPPNLVEIFGIAGGMLLRRWFKDAKQK